MTKLDELAQRAAYTMAVKWSNAPFQPPDGRVIVPPRLLEVCKEAARLVLEDVREPTEKMLAAAPTSADGGPADLKRAIYTGMIDAILNERG